MLAWLDVFEGQTDRAVKYSARARRAHQPGSAYRATFMFLGLSDTQAPQVESVELAGNLHRESTCRSDRSSWFQLAKMRLTT